MISPQTDKPIDVDVTTLKANLITLAEKAPEVCLYTSPNSQLHAFTLANGHTITIFSDQIISQPDWQNWAALQWELQEAIAVRGWNWTTTSEGYAEVANSKWDLFKVAQTGIVAVNLLSAFVSALQSEVAA